jgi:aryl-alcohol dehydrogenase-like predicted oxidoreductase
MKQHSFGPLPPVSILTLGGGGLGMLWGKTTTEECVATVHDAVAAGITLLDLAPRYGDGKAELVVGEAYGGKLPAGIRVTSKCNLGNAPPDSVEAILRQSIEASLKRLRLTRLDLFFLHSNVVPDQPFIARAASGAAERMTPYATFVDHVRPAFERFVSEGLIGAWGLTGIGHPDTIIKVLVGEAYGGKLPADHAEVRDYRLAAPFREICAELDINPAVIAHRYALSLDIDTLVLGVKNRPELAECVAAADAGPLSFELMQRIDSALEGARRAA